MKRMTTKMIAIFLIAMGMIGCGTVNTVDKKSEETSLQETQEETIKIVCTTFPQYDWIKNIIGDIETNIEVTLLLDNGVDLHNYQPSVEDIVMLSSCDLFIYIGGESDQWVENVLKDAMNSNMKVLNLVGLMGDLIKTEEIIDGMEEDHDHEEESHEEDNHEEVLDEHVWLSLKNAKILSQVIAEEIATLAPKHREILMQNVENYIVKLEEMDRAYQDIVDLAKNNVVLFADRFPFRYLVDDYGIEYYAAFPGCSAETEASFETVLFLTDKVEGLNLHYIMVTESADQSIAKTINNNTNSKDQEILVLNSMQSVTKLMIENGTTYLSIMKDNLHVLEKALN